MYFVFKISLKDLEIIFIEIKISFELCSETFCSPNNLLFFSNMYGKSNNDFKSCSEESNDNSKYK